MTEFEYHFLQNDVHELILIQATPETLEQCFVLLGRIFDETAMDQPILLLSDARQSGVPPVGLFISFARRLFSKYPKHPPIYSAVLYRQEGRVVSAFLGAVEQLARVYNMRVRFFGSDQRDKALAWLLENRRGSGKNDRESAGRGA